MLLHGHVASQLLSSLHPIVYSYGISEWMVILGTQNTDEQMIGGATVAASDMVASTTTTNLSA